MAPVAAPPPKLNGRGLWTPRVLLFVPALTQIAVAYVLFRELRQNTNAPALPVLLTFLALGGAGGIMAGIFVRSRRLLHVGILCALLGFAVPAVIHTISSAVDQDISLARGLGHYDAESLETLVFVRMLIEGPFWGLYVIIASVSYLGSCRETGRRKPPSPKELPPASLS